MAHPTSSASGLPFRPRRFEALASSWRHRHMVEYNSFSLSAFNTGRPLLLEVSGDVEVVVLAECELFLPDIVCLWMQRSA
jgi:hypothetical protein